MSFLRKSIHNGYHRRVRSKLKLVWTTLLILSTFTLSWGVCVLYFVLVCKEGCAFIYLKSISFRFGFLLNSTVNFLVRLFLERFLKLVTILSRYIYIVTI